MADRHYHLLINFWKLFGLFVYGIKGTEFTWEKTELQRLLFGRYEDDEI